MKSMVVALSIMLSGLTANAGDRTMFCQEFRYFGPFRFNLDSGTVMRVIGKPDQLKIVDSNGLIHTDWVLFSAGERGRWFLRMHDPALRLFDCRL